MLKRILPLVAIVASLLVPAGALAAVPSRADKTNAARACRAERGTTEATREAFLHWGTNANHKNAFGKCVSSQARDELRERRAAKRKARATCAAKHKRGRAYRRCVARVARAEKRRLDRADRLERIERRNAAQECDEERGDTTERRAIFADKYGENANDANAFGKCVSQHARD
jgi:hypothetical protein